MGSTDYILTGSVQTVGTTTGLVPTANIRVPRGLGKMTVTYSATGVYLFTLPAGLSFPKHAWNINVSSQCATLATDYFEVIVLGEDTLNTSTPTFTVQCKRAGSAQAPAATAGNRINFTITAGNTTGA